jgi:hypothetical protein
MTASDHHFQTSRRPERSASGLQPVSPQEATALLTSCLALVRPVGMADSEAGDWLGVAVGEVIHYPAAVLHHAAVEARRTCTHHSQVVPAIIESAEERMAHHRRMAELSAPIDLPQLPPPPALSDEEFERIVNEKGIALSAYLDRGAIISNGDGTFRRAA